MKIQLKIKCGGGGHWSNQPGKEVSIHKIELGYLNGNKTYGELRAFFDTTEWKVLEYGFIYTDSEWIHNFRFHLVRLGITISAAENVGYSEHGMQGDDFVSMDVRNNFPNEWIELENKFSKENV